jgi:hypothetical protein
MLIFQNPNPVSVSLIFQSNLNAKLSFSTVSAYVTALCFSIYSAGVSAYTQPGVSAYTTALVFQHMTQHCVSAYTTAWCFSIYSALCFSIYYSLVFQHILQPGVSAYKKKLNRK